MFLRENYKTVEGARKRAAFENGVARYKARLYAYRVVAKPDGTGWKVERFVRKLGE